MRKQTIKVEPQSLSLTAKGSFRVRTAKSTAVRCGPHGVSRTIQYTVLINSSPSMLDHRGFIIDWRDIFLAVAKKYKYVSEFPSCESFAAEICGIVEGMLDGRCNSITVNVGINGLPANMTATWSHS